MAAIIARITREKRERDQRLSKEILIAKCNYILKPFKTRFEPETANKEILAFFRLVSLALK